MLSCFSPVWLFVTLWTVACQAPPGKNTGVGCHALLQRIFPTQGLNPRLLYLLHWQVGSLPLAPLGSPFLVWLLENLKLYVACILFLLVSAGLCPLRTVRVMGHRDGLELASDLRNWMGPLQASGIFWGDKCLLITFPKNNWGEISLGISIRL